MSIEYIAFRSGGATNNDDCDIANVTIAAGQTLIVGAGSKDDGDNRPVISVTWDNGGVQEALAQLGAHINVNLHQSWWGLLAPTPGVNKTVRITYSANTDAMVGCAIVLSGVGDLVIDDWSVSNFTWVAAYPKTAAGLSVARFMLASHAHVRENANCWTPDEMTEIAEKTANNGANQKAISMSWQYKQIDDAAMEVGGDLTVDRTGHVTCLSFGTVAPTTTDCDPDNGPIAGGTSVTLTGTGFIDGATVAFGGVAADNVVVVSDTEITCDTPAHAVGDVDVVVTNSDSQAGTLTDGFEYTAGNGGKSHSRRQLMGLI